jgi:alpha-1,6-mannosyltransferase
LNFFKKNSFLFAIIISGIACLFLAYFISRDNFTALFSCYSVAFLGFVLFYSTNQKTNYLFTTGVVLRILFFFGIPFWSQDFYRFIWDGNLLTSGINPYLQTPNELLESVYISNSEGLYAKMGSLSASHYSNYPPINQLFFAFCSFFGNNSIFISALLLKLIILFSDIGIYHYGKKILLFLNQNPKKIFLYFLNPLVVIELTGNLHFEGVMLFFFVVGLYLFLKERWILAAVFIALSISTKLLPLLLLPFFYQRLGFKRSIYFFSIIIGISAVTFVPFISQKLISNYTETIGLWFTNFEFNASIYYLVREIGFYVKGYNIIRIVGKITPIITLLVILYFAIFNTNKKPSDLFANALITLSIYFFISTTVHPWYAVNLVFLSIFTRFKFPIIWSYLIILSYFAYSQIPFKENYFLLFIEYSIVFSVFIYEFFFVQKKDIYNG